MESIRKGQVERTGDAQVSMKLSQSRIAFRFEIPASQFLSSHFSQVQNQRGTA
jgi:hypothetical protein